MILDNMIKKQVQDETEKLNIWTEQHNKEIPFPKGVAEIQNVPYMQDRKSCHLMNIYYPQERQNTGSRLPVIINVHGGGLLMGTKEQNRLFCAQMSEMGFLVFCADYPLIPDVEIYQVFSDISAAVDKIEELLDTYNGDREHVYFVGDSAGAYLITYLAAMQRCPSVAAAAGITPPKLDVKALGLVSGMFYTGKKDNIGLFLTGWIYGKGWRKHPFRKYINPEHPDIVRNLPPCFLVTAGSDSLRNYTIQFYRALRRSHISCRLADCPKDKRLVHAFCVLYPEYGESRNINKQMADFLRQF